MSYLTFNSVITNVITYILPQIFTTTVLMCLFSHHMEEAIVILL